MGQKILHVGEVVFFTCPNPPERWFTRKDMNQYGPFYSLSDALKHHIELNDITKDEAVEARLSSDDV